MTTKLNQIFSNLKAAILDVKKMEGDTNKFDSFNELNKIGQLLANANEEIGDILEKEYTDLKKQEDVLSHSQYTAQENELCEMQKTATSKLAEIKILLDYEKETMATALPMYKYYDDSDGQVKNIKNLHKVYPDGGYEVKSTSAADGSYSALVFDASGKECGLKLYNKDGEPCTDMEKVAEYFEMKTDGFLNRLGAILLDIIPFSNHDNASTLADLEENEYVRQTSYVDKDYGLLVEDTIIYRWNEESAQFDEVHRKRTRGNDYMTKTVTLSWPKPDFTLDDAVDNLTGANTMSEVKAAERNAEVQKTVAMQKNLLEEINQLMDQLKESTKGVNNSTS